MGGRGRIIPLKSPEETHRFGFFCGKTLPLGAILALTGPLGAGKTSFVQGLARGLGISQAVQSPTFNYLNIYEEAGKTLYHFDLYRIIEDSDFLALGFQEYFDAKGILAIEWPERIANCLPKETIFFEFSYMLKERSVRLSSAFESNLIGSILQWD